MDYPLHILLAPYICLLLIAASLHEAFFPIAAAFMLAASYASPGRKPHAIMHSWIKKRYKAIRSRPVRYYFARTQAHPLLELPQELVDMIYQHLDAKDAACLSLCNKNLYWRLDTTRHQDLLVGTDDQGQRKDFLARLARDNPKVYLCHNCSYLHLVAKVGPPLRSTITLEMRSPCKEKLLNFREELPSSCFKLYDSSSNYSLTYDHIQLAMARHHHGQGHGISIDKLSFTEAHRLWRSKFWGLLNVEPEVINHQLHLRVQQWTIFPQNDPPTFGWYECPAICRHAEFLTTSSGMLADVLKYESQHIGAQPSCTNCRTLYRCPTCQVEFQFETLKIDRQRAAVIITKWLNVGSGQSPSGVALWLEVPVETESTAVF